jgi:hypothetical protein
MRNWITLVESLGRKIHGLSDADRRAICQQMIKAEIAGSYWDDRAMASYPGKFGGSDNAVDMIDMWKQGYWTNSPFPEQLRDLDPVEIMKTPEFRNMIGTWAAARLSEVEEKLTAIPLTKGGYLLHRVIRVPTKWLERARKIGNTSLGLHWTYDINGWESDIGAYPVWADQDKPGINLTFSVIVSPEHVDWRYTILSNMDWYSGDREFEMRPEKGTPLVILSCTNEADQMIDVSGITFVA